MTALRRGALLAALTLATLGARGVTNVTNGTNEFATPPVAPGAVLANYASALATMRAPKAMSFEYSVEQLGLHNLEQRHRVYRSGRTERDETLVVNGQPLTKPAIRILANRTNRYDITAVAPKPAGYAFVYAGAHSGANGPLYVFRTRPHVAGPFAVSEISVDGRSFLPAIVRFRIAGGNARGNGELRYGRADVYWVVRQAQVSVRLKGGASAHERITWSQYQFPASLPRSTFEAPRATPAPLPTIATPAPTPTPIPGVEPL